MIAGCLVALALIPDLCRAGEEVPLKEKSVAIATLLGLDPIPADALFYAGRPAQAMANLVVGLAGVGMIAGALSVGRTTDYNITTKLSVAAGGVGVYLITLIWDLAGGVSAVRADNEKAAQSALPHQHVRPTLAIGPNGGFGGVEVRF
ncbi:MAG: hypothetical protein V1798_01885 [Pseudomonadota bacterium]